MKLKFSIFNKKISIYHKQVAQVETNDPDKLCIVLHPDRQSISISTKIEQPTIIKLVPGDELEINFEE